jgi:hypothetical protein
MIDAFQRAGKLVEFEEMIERTVTLTLSQRGPTTTENKLKALLISEEAANMLVRYEEDIEFRAEVAADLAADRIIASFHKTRELACEARHVD